MQGYNAQAVANEGQIVLAAEVTNNTADFGQLAPMVEATLAELNNAGVDERPQVAVADAGFWNEQHIDKVVAELHVQVLIPPDAGNRKTPRPGWSGGRFDWMRTVLATDRERASTSTGSADETIEPIFGHTKHNRGIRRFHRRGRSAVRTEWRLTDGHPQPDASSTAPNSPQQRPDGAHARPPATSGLTATAGRRRRSPPPRRRARLRDSLERKQQRQPPSASVRLAGESTRPQSESRGRSRRPAPSGPAVPLQSGTPQLGNALREIRGAVMPELLAAGTGRSLSSGGSSLRHDGRRLRSRSKAGVTRERHEEWRFDLSREPIALSKG